MQDGGPGVSADSEPFAGLSNTSDQEMENSEADPLYRLAQGEEVVVKLSARQMLGFILTTLGARTEPLFSESETADGLKVTIKLHVSELRTMKDERIMYSVVEGEPSNNVVIAENNAVMKAFSHLQQNYGMRIIDFSSRLSSRYESCGVYDSVCEGMGCLEKLFTEWEMTFGQFENFTVKLEEKHFCNNVFGQLSEKGKVYTLLADDLIDVLNKFHKKTAEARAEMNDLENERKELEKRMALSGQNQLKNGTPQDVILPDKDILYFVLRHFGLDDAEYTCAPDSHGLVSSSVLMKFPDMEKHQFSGNLTITANHYTSIEASEEAAFEALVFIEKYFPVRVIDFNYSQRKKSFKQLNKFIALLSKTVAVASDIRMMWSKMNSVVEGHVGLFSFEPASVFSGNCSEGQIEAYRFCSTGLEDLKKYSLTRFAFCATLIEAMQKLTWKSLAFKSQFAT